MPRKDGTLTPKEAAFAGYMAASGDATYSAARAGYTAPQVDGWRKSNDPALAAVVKRAQMARLTNELLPAALNTLQNVLSDDKETSRNKLTAVGLVLRYTVGQDQNGVEAKEPHEMTAAELQERIERLRREQSERAKPVIEHDAGPDAGPEAGVFD